MWFKDKFIPDRSAAQDFLRSLGMNNFDIQDFAILLFQEDEDYIDWKQEAKEWELDSMQQFEKRNSLINEINELADKLKSGKGGTKKQYAERLRQLCEFWY